MASRIKTKYPGITEHHTKNPASGKDDVAYYARYRPTPGGKQIEERVGWKSKGMTPARAANERASRVAGGKASNQQRREEEAAAKAAEENRWTINRLWFEYKACKPNLKGIVTDENRFKNYIAPAFGDKEPKDIAPLDVDRLRINLLKKKSPGTVKNVLELLRRILNFGWKRRLCDRLDFTIELPRANNEKTEDLSEEQLARLLEAIEADTNRQAAGLMKLALVTGMRRGELFRLQWDHIDFSKGFIRLVDPKGGVDQRIPLNAAARQVLEEHERTGSPYVFPGRGGRQRTDINKQVNRIKRRAGLPNDFRALHGLRHHFASALASSGEVDMHVLQKLMTHKSAGMTARYAHLRDQTLQKASDVASGLLGNDKKQERKKVVNLAGRQGES